MRQDYDVTPDEGITLGDYLNVIRRRKGLILLVTFLALVPAIVITTREEVTYSATAQVLEPQASSATGSSLAQLERSAEAEARLARTPAVVDGVIAATGAELTTGEFLARSSVDSNRDSDVLDFTVTADSPEIAVTLVNAYADEFVSYRADVADRVFEDALAGLEESLLETEEAFARARAEPSAVQEPSEAPLLAQRYQELLQEQQRLSSARALYASSLVAVPAERAVKAGPQPLRNGLLALAVGLVLGTVLAFVREALDSRVRSVHEIGERLGLPLLASIPPPPRPLGSQGRLVMLESPTGPEAEAFRVLRTNLDLARQPFGTIMFTSASQSEGRTTTLANLAIALVRSGQDVILVDLDLRRPKLGRLFRLGDDRPGFTDAALNRRRLHGSLVPIALDDAEDGADGEASARWRDVEGTLQVLPAGSEPLLPGDFLGTHLLTDVLHALVEQTDFVLIDAPPILTVADAVTLGGVVDAVVATVRVDARREEIDELRRMLEACPASKLGFVLTGGDVGAPSASATRSAAREPARESGRRSVIADNPT